MIVAHTIRDWARRHPDTAELAIGAAAGLLVLVVSLLQWGLTDTGLARGVVIGVPLGGVIMWTYRRRRRRQERLDRDLLGQRLRLARELHDSVAGQVAVVGIQAAAARRVMATRPDDAMVALERIEEASRSAVTDLRRMLMTLREGTDTAGLDERERGLGELDRLLEEVRRSGLIIGLRVHGTPAVIPVAVDHAAYRIAQEALTNVLKHAGPVEASFDLTYATGGIELSIANRGGSASASPGAGLGLVGIRERTALFGGEAEAGPIPGGGWAVRVRLPYRPEVP
jgi:signal transduction histidine kinase